MKDLTQQQRVLNILRERPLSALECSNCYNMTRLSAIIHELKKQGHKIAAPFVQNGKESYCSYTLIK